MTGLYYANCQGCKARMLANGLDYWRSSKRKWLTPEYQQALKLNGLTHEAVKRAAERMGMWS